MIALSRIYKQNGYLVTLICVLALITLLILIGCGTETNNPPNVGKECSRQDDCAPETGQYCHRNPAGKFVCLREVWCVSNVCRKDCTGSCSIGYGAGYLGSYDTIDCAGDSSQCSHGEECHSLSNAYFACIPK